jgi:hypothetical protein
VLIRGRWKRWVFFSTLQVIKDGACPQTDGKKASKTDTATSVHDKKACLAWSSLREQRCIMQGEPHLEPQRKARAARYERRRRSHAQENDRDEETEADEKEHRKDKKSRRREKKDSKEKKSKDKAKARKQKRRMVRLSEDETGALDTKDAGKGGSDDDGIDDDHITPAKQRAILAAKGAAAGYHIHESTEK